MHCCLRQNFLVIATARISMFVLAQDPMNVTDFAHDTDCILAKGPQA